MPRGVAHRAADRASVAESLVGSADGLPQSRMHRNASQPAISGGNDAVAGLAAVGAKRLDFLIECVCDINIVVGLCPVQHPDLLHGPRLQRLVIEQCAGGRSRCLRRGRRRSTPWTIVPSARPRNLTSRTSRVRAAACCAERWIRGMSARGTAGSNPSASPSDSRDHCARVPPSPPPIRWWSAIPAPILVGHLVSLKQCQA